ncbi:hypothetical protein (plasmid) [Metabacillus dongyingensis]|nr:hypothetical protein [Metabacillus dongyingensis]
MPSIQDTTYPRIKSNLTVKELDEVYIPQRTEIAWTEAKSKGTLQQLALLVLIKSVQKLGYFKRVDEIPEVKSWHTFHHEVWCKFPMSPRPTILNPIGSSSIEFFQLLTFELLLFIILRIYFFLLLQAHRMEVSGVYD